MGVNLCIEDENGRKIESLLDPRSYVMYLVDLAAERETVCLRFIDPYGDTVFNQLQIPVLIQELESIRPLVTEAEVEDCAKRNFGSSWRKESELCAFSAPAIRAHLEEMLKLARRSLEVHVYLKLYGD